MDTMCLAEYNKPRIIRTNGEFFGRNNDNYCILKVRISKTKDL